eukprot:9585265-Alexandrium_andersonii.AAC.1
MLGDLFQSWRNCGFGFSWQALGRRLARGGELRTATSDSLGTGEFADDITLVAETDDQLRIMTSAQ